jgi:hypothetical protein
MAGLSPPRREGRIVVVHSKTFYLYMFRHLVILFGTLCLYNNPPKAFRSTQHSSPSYSASPLTTFPFPFFIFHELLLLIMIPFYPPMYTCVAKYESGLARCCRRDLLLANGAGVGFLRRRNCEYR